MQNLQKISKESQKISKHTQTLVSGIWSGLECSLPVYASSPTVVLAPGDPNKLATYPPTQQNQNPVPGPAREPPKMEQLLPEKPTERLQKSAPRRQK